ncbi:type I-E CRISPR-associated protein Cas6/Cse3/CasE [Belnapia sp. T18]|uniref:Type I-E CRISPR-associated protein Cas6/Cse3/CasE n=1 Tax=Belnapia arida TaxID=2804533 RepID=A0ABS1UD35_9PROT|nr:type I-E CRISPR-associated protein Cas6/Cse3/CasE [Belnapia arida]MBL6082425.1 type I-E CRISPR-associated protein Cas6/Cse3/CasE [Belnapia arida]
MTLYLNRATLRPEAERDILAAVLATGDVAGGSGHKLIWALHTDGPDRERDFLWRDAGSGTYFTLSRRPPEAGQRLFTVQSREMNLPVQRGSRLRFTLRANPVSAEPAPPKGSGGPRRGRRHDIVTKTLLPQRGAEPGTIDYDAVALAAARDWMERRGRDAGFSLTKDFVVEGRDWVSIRRRRQRPIEIGVMDLAGVLELTDPEVFMQALGAGFGRSKAFGYGLMMVRPAE